MPTRVDAQRRERRNPPQGQGKIRFHAGGQTGVKVLCGLAKTGVFKGKLGGTAKVEEKGGPIDEMA